jgi:hypothetical protein
MKRREFFRRSALVAGAVAISGPWLRAAETQPPTFDLFGPVTLGWTKIKTSRFCLGTGMRGGNRQSNHTRMGKEKFEALIRESFDRGTRLFDLADLYGTHPYVITRAALSTRGRANSYQYFAGAAYDTLPWGQDAATLSARRTAEAIHLS